MEEYWQVSFHTHNRDKRRDRVTNTVTKTFTSLEAAKAWGDAQSPHYNLYKFHEGIGFWSVLFPLPVRAV